MSDPVSPWALRPRFEKLLVKVYDTEFIEDCPLTDEDVQLVRSMLGDEGGMTRWLCATLDCPQGWTLGLAAKKLMKDRKIPAE